MIPSHSSVDFQMVAIALGFVAIPLLAMWYLIGLPVQEWRATQHWQEVPAWIDDAQLVEHHGEDGVTYQSSARYRYQVGNQRYTGERVSLYGPEDGTSYHRVIIKELVSYRDSQRPFRCYVNPSNPKDAILYRDIRWGMMTAIGLVALLFVGLGCGMLFQQIRAIRASETSTSGRSTGRRSRQ